MKPLLSIAINWIKRLFRGTPAPTQKGQSVIPPVIQTPLAPSNHPILTREPLLSRTQYFVDVNLWPFSKHFNPQGWLANFSDQDQEHAMHMLNMFCYFPDWMVEKMFLASFQSLSRQAISKTQSFLSARVEWRRLVNTSLFIRVTGENPSDADSGHLFVRLARDKIGIDESRIVSPEKGLQALFNAPTTPIVFVDDFVGSGQQFVRTWQRKYTLPGHTQQMSFEDVSTVTRASALYYCSVLCTEFGKQNIVSKCPRVLLSPAHVISNQYNLLHPECLLWPDGLKPTAVEVIERNSKRVGIPDLNGQVGDWRGFNKLGLAVGFEHGIPDATLPIFTWDKNGWTPLLRPNA